MANTEHIEKLDNIDKFSVITYRCGIALFSLALLLSCIALSDEIGLIALEQPLDKLAYLALAVSSAMSAANLHVYDKKIRIIITWSTWIGLVLLSPLDNSHYFWLPIGFLFITFSGIAMKESFCFSVPGLKAIPFLLCTAVLMLALNIWIIALACLTFSSVVFAFLAIQKWRMPLHFDIGNKAYYQN